MLTKPYQGAEVELFRGENQPMLLERTRMQLVNIDCMPTSTKCHAVIDLEVDIGELLPYLAAEIRGCTYIHGTEQLNYMYEGHIIAIRPRQITITAVPDETRAQELVEDLRSFINEVYQRRDAITPVMRKHARLDPLTVYRELPRTNCGECGETTCMAFAARVVSRELPASRCAPMLGEECEVSRERLWELLRQADYDTE